jgi:hypothetical protein
MRSGARPGDREDRRAPDRTARQALTGLRTALPQHREAVPMDVHPYFSIVQRKAITPMTSARTPSSSPRTLFDRVEQTTGIVPFRRLVDQVMTVEPYRWRSGRCGVRLWRVDASRSFRGVRCGGSVGARERRHARSLVREAEATVHGESPWCEDGLDGGRCAEVGSARPTGATTARRGLCLPSGNAN